MQTKRHVLIAALISALALSVTAPAQVHAAAILRVTDAGLIASWVYALAIDPATPTTLYAGTYVGGVFKSTNGGATWRTAAAGLASTTVSALAIDSATPATVYAGTNVRGVVVVRQWDKQVYLPFVVRGQ